MGRQAPAMTRVPGVGQLRTDIDGVYPTCASSVRSLGREPECLLEPLGIARPHLRIDDARRALAIERHDQLLGGDPAHIGAGLAGDARRVRARNYIVELQQRMVGRWWPAPAICLVRSASASARSSWMKPRAVVMK